MRPRDENAGHLGAVCDRQMMHGDVAAQDGAEGASVSGGI
jgi:hypothetical protein